MAENAGRSLKGALRRRSRTIGIVYLFYFLAAFAGAAFKTPAQHPEYLALNLVSLALYAALVVLFYVLFRPVNLIVSFAAAIAGLAGCLVSVLRLFHVLASLNPLAFFGPFCVLIGCLIIGSTFIPRVLGGLLILAGLAWLAFLWQPIQLTYAGEIESVGIVAEGALMLWLLVFGIDKRRWSEQAAKAGVRPGA
jgi:hypothetical protein